MLIGLSGACGLIFRYAIDHGSAPTSSDHPQALPDDTPPPEIYEIALKHVRASRFTDAELIYSPSQIALSALSLASPVLGQQWWEAKVSQDSAMAEEQHKVLTETSSAISNLITQDGQPPDVEAVREVDRRLRLCKNPEKVVGSKAYLARQAEEERRAEEKRTRKVQDIRNAIEEGDPFGSELAEE